MANPIPETSALNVSPNGDQELVDEFCDGGMVTMYGYNIHAMTEYAPLKQPFERYKKQKIDQGAEIDDDQALWAEFTGGGWMEMWGTNVNDDPSHPLHHVWRMYKGVRKLVENRITRAMMEEYNKRLEDHFDDDGSSVVGAHISEVKSDAIPAPVSDQAQKIIDALADLSDEDVKRVWYAGRNMYLRRGRATSFCACGTKLTGRFKEIGLCLACEKESQKAEKEAAKKGAAGAK